MFEKEEKLYKPYTNKELKELQIRFDNIKANIKFRDNIKIECLADILDNLFLVERGKNCQLIRDSREPTYYKNNREQCCHGRLRSIEDIYRISKNYGLGLSLKQVYDTINKLSRENVLNKSYCGTVKKIVHGKKVTTNFKSFKQVLK